MKHDLIPCHVPQNPAGTPGKLRRELRRLFFVAAIFAFLGPLASCASFPAPSSPEDTLLVVPYLHFDLRTAGIYPMNFSYKINVENGRTGRIFSIYINPSDANDYKYVTGLPPGKYTVKDYQAIGLVGNPKRAFRIEKSFTLEKGALSVMPLKIIIFAVDADDPQFSGMVQFDYKEVSDHEIARIVRQLGEKDGFQLWRH